MKNPMTRPAAFALIVLTAFAAVAEETGWRVETLAGTGERGYAGDGGPATQAKLDNPFGVVIGPDGCVYFCDTGNHAIRKIDSDGTIATVAGTGQAGYAGDGGPATEALLNEPYEIRFDTERMDARDAAGDLFFVERLNHTVRRIGKDSGIITTVAGTGEPGFSGDGGPANKAAMNQPHSIQFGPDGMLYICDIGNHRVRRVNLETGVIETFAGTGGRGDTPDGAPLAGTGLNGPRAIDFDEEGNAWLALREGNAVYKIDMASQTLHRIAGTGEQGFTGNGGPALNATLSGPKGIAIGPNGNVYLADTESHSVRMIDLESGNLELVAGTGERGDGPDGNAAERMDARGLECRFARLHGIFVDGEGSIYVGDSENHRVRKITRARWK